MVFVCEVDSILQSHAYAYFPDFTQTGCKSIGSFNRCFFLFCSILDFTINHKVQSARINVRIRAKSPRNLYVICHFITIAIKVVLTGWTYHYFLCSSVPRFTQSVQIWSDEGWFKDNIRFSFLYVRCLFKTITFSTNIHWTISEE